MGLLVASLLITVLAFSYVQGQSPSSEKPPSAEPEITVAFCELIRHPEQYDQKTIRVKAIYRYGFEWSQLYCLDCQGLGLTWVEFDDLFKANTNRKLVKKVSGNGDKGRTVNLVAVGKFYGAGGGYGHLGGYKFKFVIHRLEEAEIILNDSPAPHALPEKALHRACC